MIYPKGKYASSTQLKSVIAAARGEKRADLVIKNTLIFDAFTGAFNRGDVAVSEGWIVGIGEPYSGVAEIDGSAFSLVPGFIDAHVHIESSMMTPVCFQEAVLPCGTTTVVWDPHEIANVKGVAGIEWALAASENLLLDVFVMVPSCVPATTPNLGLETSGATLTAEDLAPFHKNPRILGLAEMMNFPGLLHGDPDVMAKLQQFNSAFRDGHCPGLTGRDLNAYGAAGIHSCHESTRIEEAAEKLRKGIQVLIREGSCAKDADALLPLLNQRTAPVLGFCSDDRNPADIADEGHISTIVNKALVAGHSAEEVFRASSFGPSKMFGLFDRGAIAPGYRADFCLVRPSDGKNWRSGLHINSVYKAGERVDAAKLSKLSAASTSEINENNLRDSKLNKEQAVNLNIRQMTPADFWIRCKPSSNSPGKKENPSRDARIIIVRPRQIITDQEVLSVKVAENDSMGIGLVGDLSRDILKIAVVERHTGSSRVSAAFVRGFGLKHGAIATSINHDCHNIIVVGTSDDIIAAAVERLRAIDGGIVVLDGKGQSDDLALPIGGLMTSASPASVATKIKGLKLMTHGMGCVLEEPFLQLSFLALPVIPSLKITDRGLVDVGQFKIVSVEV